MKYSIAFAIKCHIDVSFYLLNTKTLNTVHELINNNPFLIKQAKR